MGERPVSPIGLPIVSIGAGIRTTSVRLPEEPHNKAVEIAAGQQVSVDEVFASAFTEPLAAWERLRQRAARGSREEFLRVLDQAPDVEPEDYDRL